MAVELAKINRWAVTGTPLSSSFDDLVSQLYFIELEPFMTVKPSLSLIHISEPTRPY